MTGWPRPVVRSAEPRDAGDIARIYVESWRATYAGILPNSLLVNLSVDRASKSWRSRLEGYRRGSVRVATGEQGTVVGFGEAGRSRDALPRFSGEVFTLYVDPDHVDRGIGRALLRSLFARCVESGHEGAVIWALADNPCRHFYSAIGGRIVAERDSVYWGRRLREVGYGWHDLPAWLSQPDSFQPTLRHRDD